MQLTLWHIVFVCHQNDICENYIGSVYVGGYCGLSESGLCVFGKLCPVGFLFGMFVMCRMQCCITVPTVLY